MSYLELAELFEALAVSLLLGAFIGLERERAKERPLGIRSFMLVAALGTSGAIIADRTGAPWVLPALFVVVGALLITSHVQLAQGGRKGLTTELAGLFTLAIGALVYIGPMALAVALGVVTAALLHFKPELHALADRAGEREMVAMVQFGLVAFVVLPVLPNRCFGPYKVLNPYNIWLMVVLVAGINLASYLALKLVGTRAGGLTAGLLGGLVSSTATTYSFSHRVREHSALTESAALAIILATAVTVPRMAVLVGVAHPMLLRAAGLPLALVFAISVLPGLLLWRRACKQADEPAPEVHNPVQIGAAVLFGAIYALVTLALAAAQQGFGEAGTYAVSALAGLADVNAITLSTARLVATERLTTTTGADMIVIAYLANLLGKGVLAAIVGTPALARIVAPAFAFTFALGIVVVLMF